MAMLLAEERAPAPPPPPRDLVARRLAEAIRTLAALPDRERRWLQGMASSWPAPLRDFWGEFGHAVMHGAPAPPRLRPPPPSPGAIDRMLPALTRLMAVDERPRKIIWMRAFGVSWWKIGDRFGRSERTVQRWHDDAIAAIARRWPDCA
jgi:Domain of unknown function (DUF6362)